LRGSARYVEWAAALLGDDAARVREAALYATLRSPTPRLWNALTRLIERLDTSDHQRALALRSLHPPDDLSDAAISLYLGRFARHPDPFLRAAVAVASSRSHGALTRDLARALARDPDDFVAEAARTALGASLAPRTP
jgi:hypothetical protein